MQPNGEDSPGRELARDVAAAADSGAPNRHFDTSDPARTKKGKTSGDTEWLTPGRFACILAACIFAAYPEVALGVRTFFFRDFGYFGYPLAFHHRESFWRCEIPLWNPLSECGLPFLAQWNTLVLYPGSIFYLLLPLSWSLGVFCLLHQFLGGLGMYFLATHWTQNRFAACAAGVVFAFNGLGLNCLMWPNNIAALGWMPWVVMQVERAWNDGGRHTSLAVVFGTLQMLAGAPEIILFTWTVLAVLLATQMLSLRQKNRLYLKRFLAVVLLVTGLAAAQLLPFLDLLAHSQRDTSYAQSSWSMPGTGWANFLVPLFHCFSANQGVFFQYEQWWTSSYYVGVQTLVLALLAAWRVRERRVLLLAAFAVLSVVLALGDNGYAYQWLRQAVPQFGWLRYPIKFVTLAVFCFPLLAAYGVRWIQRHMPGRAGFYVRWVFAGWAGPLALMAGLLWFARHYPYQWDEWQQTKQNAAIRAIFFMSFLALLPAAFQARQSRLQRLLQIALVFLMWLDFMTHAPRQNPTVQRAAFEPGLLRLSPTPGHGVSRAMIGPDADMKFRTASVREGISHYIGNRLGLFSNCNLLEDIPKVNGFFSLYLREAHQVCSLLYPPVNANLPRLTDFLNVSHITARGKLFEWELQTNYLPFVTAGQRPSFENETNTLRALTAPDFSPRRVVYLPVEARPFVTAGETSVRIEASRFSDHRGEIIVEASAPALVVVSQAHQRPWKASVDGQRARLWRANYAFQAVEVPAGRHEVRLVYRDTLFHSATLVSITTLAGLLISSFGRFRAPANVERLEQAQSVAQNQVA